MRALWLDEIYGFLDQSNISRKNLSRLEQLEAKEISEVASLASLVRQIAEVHPRKRKRWQRLRRLHSHLFGEAVHAGIVEYISEPMMEFPEDLLETADIHQVGWGVWISPRPHEAEPTGTELRDAANDNTAPL